MQNPKRAPWLSLFLFLLISGTAVSQQVRSEIWSANIYPNPSQGIVHIELSGKHDELTHINIVDSKGQSVHVEDVFNDKVHRIDLRSVPKGTYTLRLTSTNVYSKQIIIIR